MSSFLLPWWARAQVPTKRKRMLPCPSHRPKRTSADWSPARNEAQQQQQSGNKGGNKPDANRATTQGWIWREGEPPSIPETPQAAAQKIASMSEKTMANQGRILRQRHSKGHEEETRERETGMNTNSYKRRLVTGSRHNQDKERRTWEKKSATNY